MRITKEQVINALLTEPLMPGHFSRSIMTSDDGRDNGTCEVCAVGAILRSIKPNFNSEDGYRLTDDVASPSLLDLALDTGNFFSILSTFFENTMNDHWDRSDPNSDFTPDDRIDLCLYLTEAFFPECGYVDVEL